MRAFASEVEERARRFGLLRDWRGAGLLDEATAARLSSELGEPLGPTGAVRAVLFLFTSLCVVATVFLAVKDVRDRSAGAVIFLACAAIAVGLAEALIGLLRVYRHGVEEALIASAVVLASIGAQGLAGGFSARPAALAFAVAAGAAYARYGYRMMAALCVVGLGFFAGSCELGDRALRIALAAGAVAGWTALDAAPLSSRESERLESVRFLLALAGPLCLNLRLAEVFSAGRPSSALGDAFGWATFLCLFLLPVGSLALGARRRSRALLWAGGLGLLIGVCSVKPYLGLLRHSWDPAALGLELLILGVGLHRWLGSGPGGRRGGFSCAKASGERVGGALGLLAGAVASGGTAPASEGFRGGGGSSGGAGASGGF